jgi:hypothetical protein
MFIREIKGIKQNVQSKWMLMGDFKLIYKKQDKSHGRQNTRLMLRFTRGLNLLEVKEMELIGQHFTWSNNKQKPTLTRIDRAFSTLEWEDLYSNPILQPLSSLTSNHYPLLLM